MPRSAVGVYTLPVAPFTPNTIIKSADVNSDFSDVATALTQSLATTGVSTMTGAIKAFAGSQTSPGYTFAAALHTGFFLSGTDEISWVANGAVGAVFGANTTVSWSGNVIYNGGFSVTGSISVGTVLHVGATASIGGDLVVAGSLNNASGGAIISTSSVNIPFYEEFNDQLGNPTSAAVTKLRLYAKSDASGGVRPYVIDASAQVSPLLFTGGQCQLKKSGTSLLLSPFGGNRLTINGVPCIIPDVGVSLPASNTAAVFVYIYAVATAGAVTSLEMSTTAPTIATGTGVQQKSGDVTRTLVGAAYTDTGGAWADTDGKLWVLSYFNRRPKASRTTITASTTVNSTTYLEINAGMRNNFIAWASTAVQISANVMAFPGNIGSFGFTQIQDENGVAYDAAAVNAAGAGLGALSSGNINTAIEGVVTEATTHYATIFGRATSSVTTWILGTVKETNSIVVYVQG